MLVPSKSSPGPKSMMAVQMEPERLPRKGEQDGDDFTLRGTIDFHYKWMAIRISCKLSKYFIYKFILGRGSAQTPPHMIEILLNWDFIT